MKISVAFLLALSAATSANAQNSDAMDVGSFGVFEIGWASANTGDRCALTYTDPANYTALAMVWIPSAGVMQTALSNQNWGSIEAGRSYTVTLSTDASVKSLSMVGFVQPYRNPKMGVVAVQKDMSVVDFISDAKDATQLTVNLDGKALAHVEMVRMPEKYNNFVRCFNQSRQADPFAR